MVDVPCYAGVDVGGRRKGFDVAILDAHGVLRCHGRRLPSARAVWDLIAHFSPAAIAVDSPRRPAPDGCTSREDERALSRAGICKIRWTPDHRTIEEGGRYYEWIRCGLGLYDLLEERTDAPVIEVFPTASWTRWHRHRGSEQRSTWSTAALTRLGIAESPERTSQDLRDAIAAAGTAYQWAHGETEAFGEIVVPRGGWPRFGREAAGAATPAVS